MEANPTRFYKAMRSYWRRRKYQKLENSANHGRKKKAVVKLGLGGAATDRRRFWRIRRKLRFQVKIPTLMRILTGIRDQYVGWMLSFTRKGSGLALPETPAWLKAWPVNHRKVLNAELKLMFQVYYALVVSGEIESCSVKDL